MEKKLYGFLKHLEQESKSKSSIKNYKADINQFLKWKAEVSPETSISHAFSLYKNFLESKYSDSSILRKESSIRSFIKYAYPFENQSIEKEKSRNMPLIYLTTFSLSLSILLILFIVSPFLINGGEKVIDLKLGKVQITNTDNRDGFEDGDGIVLSVSAPSIDQETNDVVNLDRPCKFD